MMLETRSCSFCIGITLYLVPVGGIEAGKIIEILDKAGLAETHVGCLYQLG